MSGITGFLNVDGLPADPALLQRLTCAFAHRGPDGLRHWIAGPVGLGHAMFHTTPESLQETQPLFSQRSGNCLTLDGRVDNRRELHTALQSKGYAPRDDTDAELVLMAYECWGEECARHIIGDFAFAIWDVHKRVLFCARDLLGIRPFYYRFDGRAFIFSSEVRPLLEAPGLQRRLNAGMLGEHLCDRITSLDETLYQDILRLPPAHRLVLKDGAIRISRYFDFDPGKTLRYGSDREYAEHFFEIFRVAVGCRMRSQAPVALWLSGGLDSCSILGMAGQLVRDGAIARGHLAGYTLAVSHPDADERGYVREASDMWNFAVRTLNNDDLSVEPLVVNIRRHQDFPDIPNLSPWQGLYARARQSGSRVNLWGIGGDHWLTGDEAHCADLLRGFRIPALLRQFRHDLALYRIWGEAAEAFPLRKILKWCVYPLIPRPFKSAGIRLLGGNLPPWISPGFARSVSLQDRFMRRMPAPRFPTIAQQRIHANLNDGFGTFAMEQVSRMEAHQAIEGRHPFHDRRLIEFALALPEDQRWRADQTKYVLRQAMGRHLPDSIRQRRSKADFSSLFNESLAREGAGAALQTLRLARDGYVDAAEVLEVHKRGLESKMQNPSPMWMILAAERWINEVFPASVQELGCLARSEVL